jgi:DNA-binding CsgD family transcriptional regulator
VALSSALAPVVELEAASDATRIEPASAAQQACAAPAAGGFTRIVPVPLMPRSAWSVATADAIAEKLGAGGDVLEIAHAFHVCASDVYAQQVQLRALGRSREPLAPSPRSRRPRQRTASKEYRRELQLRCAEPRRLWLQGMSIKEIATAQGMTSSSLRDLMEHARQALGEDNSFPYRTILKHRMADGEAMRLLHVRLGQQYAQAHHWWCAGVDRASIARRIGMTPERFHSALKRVRRLLGNDWFPPRDLQPISDTASGGMRPRCAEDHALVIGLMCWTPAQILALQPPPAASGTTVPPVAGGGDAAALPERIRALATHSQFCGLLQELQEMAAGVQTLCAPTAAADHP